MRFGREQTKNYLNTTLELRSVFTGIVKGAGQGASNHMYHLKKTSSDYSYTEECMTRLYVISSKGRQGLHA